MTQFTGSLPAHFVDCAERPVYNHIGVLCRVVIDSSGTGGAFSIVEERGRAGHITPRHIHERESETFVVLGGELEGWAAGKTERVIEGNLMFLSANVEHAFRIVSPTAHFLTPINPAGFETSFEDSGVPLTQDFSGELPVTGPLTPIEVAALQEILAPLGCTITGRPPFDVG